MWPWVIAQATENDMSYLMFFVTFVTFFTTETTRFAVLPFWSSRCFKPKVALAKKFLHRSSEAVRTSKRFVRSFGKKEGPTLHKEESRLTWGWVKGHDSTTKSLLEEAVGGR